MHHSPYQYQLRFYTRDALSNQIKNLKPLQIVLYISIMLILPEKVDKDFHKPLNYPQDLHLSYQVLHQNLNYLNVSEANRSDEEQYEEELKTLAIKIEYPIYLERYQTFNTIIIRHALALHNFYKKSFCFEDRRIYSSQLMDPPLHYFGQRQCNYLKNYIHEIDFSVIYISPLQRTVQTAQLLFHDHPKKNQIKFILLPLASEKIGSHFQFFKWGRLAQLKADMIKNPDLIQIDLSAFDEFKHKELWQLEMLNKSDNIYDLDRISDDKCSFNESQEKFVNQHFVKVGKSISLESEELCYRRGLRLKEIMRQATSQNYNSNNKVGLISHSVLIKTFFAKGLDQERKIIKDPNFQLENGNIIALNL